MDTPKHMEGLKRVTEAIQGFRVIDVHHHLGSLGAWVGEGRAHLTDEEDVATRLAFIERWGIDAIVLLPPPHQPATRTWDDVRSGNDVVAKHAQLFGDRAVAATASIPAAKAPDTDEEIRRCVEELGMQGFVWHHRFEGRPIDFGDMMSILSTISEFKVPVFIHCLAESVLEAIWRVPRLARQFPDITFVALDALSSSSNIHLAREVLRGSPNVVVETALMVPVANMLSEIVSEVGAERVVYGSDYFVRPPSMSCPSTLFEIVSTPISDDAKRLILGENALRILGAS